MFTGLHNARVRADECGHATCVVSWVGVSNVSTAGMFRCGHAARDVLCECHLRVCVTHLFSSGGWEALGEPVVYEDPLQRALHEDEWRRTPIELEAGYQVGAPRCSHSLVQTILWRVRCFVTPETLEPAIGPGAYIRPPFSST